MTDLVLYSMLLNALKTTTSTLVNMLKPAQSDVLIAAWGQSNMAGWSVIAGADGIDYADADRQDPRIVVGCSGRGPELMADPTFRSGNNGFTSPNGTINGGGTGLLTFVSSAGTDPYISQTLTGFTVGDTIEIIVEWQNLVSDTTNVVLRATGSATDLWARYGTLKRQSDPTLFVTTRKQYSLGATSVNLNLTGVTSSAGTPQFSVRKFSVRKVLPTGATTHQAVMPLFVDVDPADSQAISVDPAFHMAKGLLERGAATRVTILPDAIGGTGLVGPNSQAVWDPDSPGSSYTRAINNLAAHMTDNPRYKPVLVWCQGEWDATVGNSSVYDYTEKMKTLVKNARAIPGCENMPVIVGSMVPEYIRDNASIARIDDAHRQLPYAIPDCTYAPAAFGNQRSDAAFHFTPAGYRANGEQWADILARAE